MGATIIESARELKIRLPNEKKYTPMLHLVSAALSGMGNQT